MSDRDRIQAIVDEAVGQVLNNSAAALRTDIARRVMEEVGDPADSAPPGSHLARGIKDIHTGTSQKEILRALLDAGAKFGARVALFVVKNAHASGWQSRGFGIDAVKDFALNGNAPAVSNVLGERNALRFAISEFDTQFFERFGAPVGGEACLLPLMLKEKVAALVYADAGPVGTQPDLESLEALVLATGSWLEVNVARKQGLKDAASVPGTPSSAPPEPACPPEPAFNDPFAAHAPVYAMAAAASAEAQPATVVSVPETSVSNFEQPAGVDAPAAVVEAPPLAQSFSPPSGISTEEEEVHLKARRFARLLVEEIKLYNREQVEEGRKNNDLLERLKDVIEKSRSTYQKRYGNTVAASGNYFEDEVKRSLAEDEPKSMLPNQDVGRS